MSVARIDGDIVAYRAAAAAQTVTYKVYKDIDEEGNGTGLIMEFRPNDENGGSKQAKELAKVSSGFILKETTAEPVSHAIHLAKQIMDDMCRNVNTKEAIVYLSCEGDTFRHKIAKIRPYKGNRDPNNKPHNVDGVKKWLREYWGALEEPELEADDLIGREFGEGDVLCSIDKDLDQIPGKHYNFVKREFYTVSPEQATRTFYIQLLTGDSTDNILGIPGIGIKRAEKMLPSMMNEQEMWEMCCLAYYVACGPGGRFKDEMLDLFLDLGYSWQDVLAENAKLVWILKDEKMWVPKFPFPEIEP